MRPFRLRAFMARRFTAVCMAVFALPHTTTADRPVIDPAGEVPVVTTADVVVVGGTSAGVAAAVAAADQGTRVVLLAPRPYLGEDLCGTYRLWLEPEQRRRLESGNAQSWLDLARRLFEPTVTPVTVGRTVAFTYQADRPTAALHLDTDPPSRLTDGRFNDAPSQSVQYDGDVVVTARLKHPTALRAVHVLAYQRPADFEVRSVAVELSPDGRTWTPAGRADNAQLDAGGFEKAPIRITVPIEKTTTTVTAVRLTVRKTPRSKRILLAEVLIEPAEQDTSDDEPTPPPTLVRPMQVKHALDQALIDAGVEFYFTCFATDMLRDDRGRCAGVVFTDKSGRWAIPARIVIDATWRATIARAAGADTRPYPADDYRFQRIVVGGSVVETLAIGTRTLSTAMPDPADPMRNCPAHLYALSLPMSDGSFPSFAAAEQRARDMTWTTGQLDAAETLFQVPPDPIIGRRSVKGPWPGADRVDLGAFRPRGIDGLYVAGPCADVSRNAAVGLGRPLNMLAVGDRIGRAAATEAARIQPRPDVGLPADGSRHSNAFAVASPNPPAHRTDALHGTIRAGARSVPVWAEYDVVVVGGGTGGAPAGISAARAGAKTLVIELLHGLGGVGTMGLISKYYHGNRVGFTAEIDAGVAAFGEHPHNRPGSWNVEWKMEWYRKELRKAGADIWLGTIAAEAVMDGNRVRGVVVANEHGRGAVLARTVIDATGNAAIAAAAGAPCVYIGPDHVALQGTGLPPRALGAGYTNTDYTFIDDTDTRDIWRSFVMARARFAQDYDLGQLIDTRERRRIVGDFVIDPLDIWNHRTYPDTVVVARSNFDTHGFTVHPVFTIRPPDRADIDVNVPYRALLPRGIDGLIVIGLGVSAHRDAMPVIRMQADIQNQGYAMGRAAAMLAKTGRSTRQLDIKALQKHLVEIGNLPPRVLTDTDSFPLPDARLDQAVTRVVNDYADIQVLLSDPDRALPRLHKAYASATDPNRLVYAHIMGMFGDATGADTLLEAVAKAEWDKGWRFTGMGQFGPSMSRLDSLIIALGRTRDPRALDVILQKLRALGPSREFSHYRALAVALETLADPRAARPLYDLLQQPGMTGHALLDIRQALARQPKSPTDTSTREKSLTELHLARALFRCGDFNRQGRSILEQYTHDLRAPYARHATAVLQASP